MRAGDEICDGKEAGHLCCLLGRPTIEDPRLQPHGVLGLDESGALSLYACPRVQVVVHGGAPRRRVRRPSWSPVSGPRPRRRWRCVARTGGSALGRAGSPRWPLFGRPGRRPWLVYCVATVVGDACEGRESRVFFGELGGAGSWAREIGAGSAPPVTSPRGSGVHPLRRHRLSARAASRFPAGPTASAPLRPSEGGREGGCDTHLFDPGLGPP